MIKWLANYIGTASYEEGSSFCNEMNYSCVDVRDLVDKEGNTVSYVAGKIESGLRLLEQGKKVVVCCDYGMSRSNAIAIGIISKYEKRNFNDVVKSALCIIGEGQIKTEVLNLVYKSMQEEQHEEKNSSAILVTGANGFLGDCLVQKMREKGFTCITPTRAEVELEKDSIGLNLLVQETKPAQIVHLANPRVYTCNSAMGKSLVMLKNVLDVCVEHKMKLIYPSTWEVYSGYKTDELIAGEDLPLFPHGTYGQTKFLCEQMIQLFQKQRDLSYTLVRFPFLYGATSSKPKFIHNFIQKAINNKSIVTHLYKNGEPKLDLLFVGDAVAALSEVISNDISGEYNIGTGRGISTKRVAEIIVKTINSKSEMSYNKIDAYTPNIVMDSVKFSRLTKWKSKVNFEDWIVQYIKLMMK